VIWDFSPVYSKFRNWICTPRVNVLYCIVQSAGSKLASKKQFHGKDKWLNFKVSFYFKIKSGPKVGIQYIVYGIASSVYLHLAHSVQTQKNMYIC